MAKFLCFILSIVVALILGTVPGYGLFWGAVGFIFVNTVGMLLAAVVDMVVDAVVSSTNQVAVQDSVHVEPQPAMVVNVDARSVHYHGVDKRSIP